MAAPAEGRDTPIASLNRETKVGRRGNDPTCLIPQNRSGCSFPKVPPPRPARRLRFWVFRAITSRSAIPRPGAFRGSRGFVRKFHRCPGLRDDPAGYLAFIEQRLADGKFDVLLPTHEQGFLFARAKQRIEGRAGLALPSFASYRTAHSKAGFSRLLDRLELPQPPTHIVTSAQQLREAIRFPAVVKTSVGTASRGIWFIRNADDLEGALHDLGAGDAFADEVLGARPYRGHDREGAVGVLPRPDGRLSCLSAGCGRRWRRRGDQAEREAARRSRASRKGRTGARLARSAVDRLPSCPMMVARRC